jgi:predicted MFS family arabinose efflux permease
MRTYAPSGLTAPLPESRDEGEHGGRVFGGIALAVVVGVPATVLEVSAWQGRRETDRAAVAVGALLIGWTAVELPFIRELSFLQAFFVGVGISLVVIGGRSGPQPQPRSLRSTSTR